jgi:periplasmic mercuric ion binding protein
MKRLSATLLAILLATSAANAAERQAKILVTGLTCPSCPYIAAQAVESIKSVEVVGGQYDAQAQRIVFIVSYDDAVTTPEAIAAAPQEYGYPARVLDGSDS